MSSGYSPYRKFLSCIFPADAGEGEQSAFVIASLIQDYTNEVSNLLAEFRRAVENGGSRDIGLSMHSLRSNSKLFGAARLADLCRSLEIAAQTKRNTRTRGFSRIFCKLAKHLDSRL